MGYSSIIAIRNAAGEYAEHWSHGGGYDLGHDLIRFGPEAFATFSDERWRGGYSRIDKPLPTTPQRIPHYCEAGVYIDWSTHTLLWQGNSLELDPPRVVTKLIEMAWPGWTVLWAAFDVPQPSLRASSTQSSLSPEIWAPFRPAPDEC